MDPYTFGNSKAAVTLAKILDNEYPHCTTKVSRCLDRYNHGLRILFYSIKDFSVMIHVLGLYRDDAIKNVKESNLPEVLHSFTINLMHKNCSLYSKIAEKMRRDEVNKSKNRSKVSD